MPGILNMQETLASHRNSYWKSTYESPGKAGLSALRLTHSVWYLPAPNVLIGHYRHIKGDATPCCFKQLALTPPPSWKWGCQYHCLPSRVVIILLSCIWGFITSAHPPIILSEERRKKRKKEKLWEQFSLIFRSTVLSMRMGKGRGGGKDYQGGIQWEGDSSPCPHIAPPPSMAEVSVAVRGNVRCKRNITWQ